MTSANPLPWDSLTRVVLDLSLGVGDRELRKFGRPCYYSWIMLIGSDIAIHCSATHSLYSLIKRPISIFQAPFDCSHWFGSSGITYVTFTFTYEEFPIPAVCKQPIQQFRTTMHYFLVNGNRLSHLFNTGHY